MTYEDLVERITTRLGNLQQSKINTLQADNTRMKEIIQSRPKPVDNTINIQKIIESHVVKESLQKQPNRRFKDKICTNCHKVFTPNSGRQVRCDDCFEIFRARFTAKL